MLAWREGNWYAGFYRGQRVPFGFNRNTWMAFNEKYWSPYAKKGQTNTPSAQSTHVPASVPQRIGSFRDDRLGSLGVRWGVVLLHSSPLAERAREITFFAAALIHHVHIFCFLLTRAETLSESPGINFSFEIKAINTDNGSEYLP